MFIILKYFIKVLKFKELMFVILLSYILIRIVITHCNMIVQYFNKCMCVLQFVNKYVSQFHTSDLCRSTFKMPASNT